MSNYQLPNDEKGKSRLIKDLLAGRVKLEDLKVTEEGWKITLDLSGHGVMAPYSKEELILNREKKFFRITLNL